MRVYDQPLQLTNRLAVSGSTRVGSCKVYTVLLRQRSSLGPSYLVLEVDISFSINQQSHDRFLSSCCCVHQRSLIVLGARGLHRPWVSEGEGYGNYGYGKGKG